MQPVADRAGTGLANIRLGSSRHRVTALREFVIRLLLARNLTPWLSKRNAPGTLYSLDGHLRIDERTKEPLRGISELPRCEPADKQRNEPHSLYDVHFAAMNKTA